jgi:hypothetical protein
MNEPVREALDEGFEKLRGPLNVVVFNSSIVGFEKELNRALGEGLVPLTRMQVTHWGYRMVMGRVS